MGPVELQPLAPPECHPERGQCGPCQQWSLVPETVDGNVSSSFIVACNCVQITIRSWSLVFQHSSPQTPPGSGFLSLPFGDPSSELSEDHSSPEPKSQLCSAVLSLSVPKQLSADQMIT